MKREQKSLTNKGFSLVELIIVVAIMAVLIGVLAPQYMRYVEKTKLQRDNTGISDVANVLKISATEQEVNTAIAAATGAQATLAFSGTPLTMQPSAVTELNDEVNLTIKMTDVQLTSSSYTKSAADGDVPTLIVKVDSKGIVSVSCDKWIEKPGEAPTTKNF